MLEQNKLADWGESEIHDDGLLGKYNYDFDASQSLAMALGLNKKRPVLIIQGPPGTGKTGLLSHLIDCAVRQGERVLVTAPSNAAVDNMVEKLSGTRLNIVRVGNPARISPSVLSRSLGEVVKRRLEKFTQEFERKKSNLRKDLKHCIQDDSLAAGIRQLLKKHGKNFRKKENQTIKEVLSNADVVLSTNIGAADPLIKGIGAFDLVIIDEAGQAIEPSCWIPILQGKRCILAGDQKQLAPVILSREAMQGGLGMSLLERASSLHDDLLATKLTMQYRMHESIANWASNEMYCGLLKSSPSVASRLLVDYPSIQVYMLCSSFYKITKFLAHIKAIDHSACRCFYPTMSHATVCHPDRNFVVLFSTAFPISLNLLTDQVACELHGIEFIIPFTCSK